MLRTFSRVLLANLSTLQRIHLFGAIRFYKLTGVWWFLWPFYFVLESSPTFYHNYTEAWRRKFHINHKNFPDPEHSLLMFVDNMGMMELPCLWDMDDKMIIQHIREFYYLRRCERGLKEALGLKSLELVEIVEVGT